MQAVGFLFSLSGRLRPQPFIYGAAAVYLVGVASHFLTTPNVLGRAGLWPFLVAQFVLTWIWFTLHAQRLRDAGRTSSVAVGVCLLYVLSIVLLLIVADSFFNTSNGPMADANATSALWLILILYIVAALLGSTQYDLGWAVVVIMTLMAFLPIVVALAFTVWTATRPSVDEA